MLLLFAGESGHLSMMLRFGAILTRRESRASLEYRVEGMHVLVTDLFGDHTDFVCRGSQQLAAHSNAYGLQIMMPALAGISAEQSLKMAFAEAADLRKTRQRELMHVLSLHVLKDIMKRGMRRLRGDRLRMLDGPAELNDQL